MCVFDSTLHLHRWTRLFTLHMFILLRTLHTDAQLTHFYVLSWNLVRDRDFDNLITKMNLENRLSMLSTTTVGPLSPSPEGPRRWVCLAQLMAVHGSQRPTESPLGVDLPHPIPQIDDVRPVQRHGGEGVCGEQTLRERGVASGQRGGHPGLYIWFHL